MTPVMFYRSYVPYTVYSCYGYGNRYCVLYTSTNSTFYYASDWYHTEAEALEHFSICYNIAPGDLTNTYRLRFIGLLSNFPELQL